MKDLNKELFLNDLPFAKGYGGASSMRDAFGEALVEIARRNEKIVVLSGNLMESVRTKDFKEEFEKRFFEMGIAEQNMMGVAAGLALSGKIPVAATFACFSPGRNWEQTRLSVAFQKANVKIIGGHAGFGNGGDGANQQMFEDIALARVLPNMVVMAPCDAAQMKKALAAAIDYVGPVYIRMTPTKREVLTSNMTPFVLGKAQVMKEGGKLTLVACGQMVFESLKAAESFGGDVEVINVHTIKPLDGETIIRSAKKTGRVITVEEHSVIGGLGGAVCEVLVEEMPVKVTRLGMKDCFGESGEVSELMEKYGLDAEGIRFKIDSCLRRNDVGLI